jgi:hypothetical protein
MTPKGRGGFDRDQIASAGNTAESPDIRGFPSVKAFEVAGKKSPADQPAFAVISGGAKTKHT